MAKLPPLTRLLKEDFRDQSWIDKLLLPLNQFFSSVYSALNRNLTIPDNMRGDVKTLTFTSDGSGNATASFAWNLSVAPTDLWVTRIISGVPTGAIQPTWTYDGRSINISSFTGLDDNTKYIIRVIAIANG